MPLPVDRGQRLGDSWALLRETIMFRAVTRNIEVEVEPIYLPERSDPEESR